MKTKELYKFVLFASVVLFVYTSANSQIVEKVKDAAGKTKDVTVKTTKKAAEVVTDVYDKTDDKAAQAKDATVDAAKETKPGVKKFGKHTVNVTENVAGQAYEGGRWLTVTTWNGTKWVSKRVWFTSKKTAEAAKEAATGNEEKPDN